MSALGNSADGIFVTLKKLLTLALGQFIKVVRQASLLSY